MTKYGIQYQFGAKGKGELRLEKYQNKHGYFVYSISERSLAMVLLALTWKSI
ncbi:hypothetical protein FUAX_52630 (plasmid) [Fulvitalea axinellae]|uniref:Uncharacterized protein n=1 Tax=Fulvitalea axinellae TaxID=1182444 RepID=A0AAU9CLF1_9BACT|nr:hypothetical protein FUAX_52630 [Fulvitalea axinellae]